MLAVHTSIVTPFVAVLGNLGTLEFDEFYVVLNRQPLQVDTLLQAINVCFKSYFALALKFPPEAYSIYSFLDNVIFKINQNEMTPTGQMLTSYVHECHAQAT